jgi:TRAP-type C4-dicarboxylate transport system permease small subunit
MTPQEQAALEAATFVEKFNKIILYPTIALLSAVAFLVFVWGCFEYFMNAANEQGRQQGVKHITYGTIGLVVMISAWGILTIATATFGLDDELDCAKDPSNPFCAGAFTLPAP